MIGKYVWLDYCRSKLTNVKSKKFTTEAQLFLSAMDMDFKVWSCSGISDSQIQQIFPT